MKNAQRFVLLATVAFSTLPAGASLANTPPANPPVIKAAVPTTLPRAEVEAIVKDYLLTNPEVIIEAVTNYQKKQAEEAEKKASQVLVERKDELFHNPNSPAVGDPARTDVTIVEFFDYHCGYCKHLLPVITQLMKDDPKVRVVFKELPILSEDSRLAAKAALVVHSIEPKKYFEYHTALMNMSGKYTEANLAEAAKKLGVNEAKFKEGLKNPAFEQQLDKNQELAKALNIMGTPAIVTPEGIVPGATDIKGLKEAVSKVRAAVQPAKN